MKTLKIIPTGATVTGSKSGRVFRVGDEVTDADGDLVVTIRGRSVTMTEATAPRFVSVRVEV